ncbi:hypothetical protein DXB19_13135 [Lachnospiraceae bacterium OM02-26]|jgi:hypothetical protein|nr:hypothetical protein DXB19_13135 [Lachnospiraceae bacterium OM02-26]DAV95255.1 MAG TPA: hypothetical protein [Caudoviricetes sp.]DAY47639.1 MAG TPA: hypothetical protein [Caudoviricetes sp.]
MAYRDCPCFKCGEKQREERVACRKKCTEFTAWKLATQAARNKRDEENKKFHSETRKKFAKRKTMNQKSGRKV